jgi:hypothetical protein
MAFHGDLSSYPLPDLLQFLDASRKTGTLQLQWEAGERKLFLVAGHVSATASPGLWERIARMLSLSRLASGEAVLAACAAMARSGGAPEEAFRSRGVDLGMATALARDELYGAVADLVMAQGGRFHWSEDPDRSGDEWVPLDSGLRELLFETLRWVDEQPEVERALPRDSMTVRTLVKPSPEQAVLHRVILTLCEGGSNLGRLRLAMGASRSSTTRRILDLLRVRWVQVDGAPDMEADPIMEMLEKGSVLVRERQFDAAGLVFSALLASDPADRRVREFARMVEREHVAALYRELPPIFVPDLADEPETLSLLRPEERHVAGLVNGKWDVSTIVLASQWRELDTLKCLSKLRRLGLLRARGDG